MATHGASKDIHVPSPKKLSKTLTRSLLKEIYEKAACDGRIPTPDEAIEKMHELIAMLSGDVNGTKHSAGLPKDLARFNVAHAVREAHHYAVDLYYAAVRPQKGAPPLRRDYLNQLLALRSQGLSPTKIAIKLGFDTSYQSTDRVRKQLRIAQNKDGKK